MAATGLDYEAIKEQLEEAEWDRDLGDPEGGEVRRVFLGTVFALCPSGKYYTPWACSNVTEEEAERDNAWYEEVEAELEKFDASLVHGEGDPCDLFAEQYREVEDGDG